MSDLSAPLARRTARAAQRKTDSGRRHLPVARLSFAAIAVLLSAVALWVVFVDAPDGGRPVAEAAINNGQILNRVPGSNDAGLATITPGPEIPIGDASLQPVDIDDEFPIDAGAPLVDEAGNLAELVEDTAHGAIPRISGTGITPFAAYARPSVTRDTAGGKPLIAIVVTGLGISATGTLEAIEKLPDAVTLAFAPYGNTLERSVGSARANGHEIFLEVPLEPFDYPENDPGPDTLLTGQAPRDNLNKLHAVMARLGGYVGLINNMGARFTASGADFGPVMEEVGARGLGYLDDGSSNRSLANQLATANRVPFSRVDMMLDNNPARAPILKALAELEERARQQGAAIGTVSAMPVSVQTVAEWARGLEEKGILLVPASALMQ
jgi:uncharacterized protein